MTDLITRLRNGSAPLDDPDLNDEAADEIKRLRAELQYAREGLTKGRTRMREDIERLRAALDRITRVMGPTVPPCCEGCSWEWHEALTVAREALEKP